MKFLTLALPDVRLVESEPRSDSRGSFARVFCADEFASHGLASAFVQANVSINHRRGIVRGLHWQRPPHAEVKLVRCTRGAIYDVVVDIRPDSPTHLRWVGVELSAENGRMMYVPEGFAHGYQTLTDLADVHYMVSCAYAPASEAGMRFDDPALAIAWPLEPGGISDKDAAWPLLEAAKP